MTQQRKDFSHNIYLKRLTQDTRNYVPINRYACQQHGVCMADAGRWFIEVSADVLIC